jgi:hypothetical protein
LHHKRASQHQMPVGAGGAQAETSVLILAWHRHLHGCPPDPGGTRIDPPARSRKAFEVISAADDENRGIVARNRHHLPSCRQRKNESGSVVVGFSTCSTKNANGVSVLQHSSMAGHFSAHGMPDGARVMCSAYGWPPHATLVLEGCPRRDRGLVIVVGPSAGGAWRNAPGSTTRRSHRRISVSHLGNKATVRICCRPASRHVSQGCKRRVRPATLPQCGAIRHCSCTARVDTAGSRRSPTLGCRYLDDR